MSLRNRQKIARKKIILESARELFQQHGYSKTNMDDIADLAEVGVATIYTYFESKDGVFAALMRSDMEKLKDQVDGILDDLSEDPVEALIDVFKIYLTINEDVRPELIRDFIIRGKSKGISQDTIKWVHAWQTKQVIQVLKKGQENKTVSESLDLNTAARIMIDMYEYHTNLLATRPNQKDDNLDLSIVIKVLFDNWRST